MSQWSIHTDRSCNRQAGGAGVVLFSPEGDKIKYMICLNFPTTNNEAEYGPLVAGLNLAKAAGAASVVIHYNSQVVTNQVNGDYDCKRERMKKIPGASKEKGGRLAGQDRLNPHKRE